MTIDPASTTTQRRINSPPATPTTLSAPPDPGFGAVRARLQQSLLAGYPEHIARSRWDRKRIVAHQQAGLRALLAHAATHSPFHARRLAGVDLECADPTDLSALPVMTKTEMMNELDDVFTDRRLTREHVEATLAATAAAPVPLPGGHLALVSGGSSGERGIYAFDQSAMAAFLAALSRALVARLTAAGGPPPGGLSIAMVGAASAIHATGCAAALTAGGAMPFHIQPAPVTLPMPALVTRLNRLAAPALFGYPTMLARLAAERTAGRLRIDPAMITSTSEPLTPELRAAIAAGFHAPIIDAFGSTEGLVGTSAPDDPVQVFNTDQCIVELVDADNRPVPAGTPSAKVLLTNLANRLQPLIRYVITDSFAAQPPDPDHGHLRACVTGRSDDVFRYGPLQIHPGLLRAVLVRHRNVLEYQVRQLADGLEVDAVPSATWLDTAALAHDLRTALTDAGLPRPRARVRSVAGITRHPDTGKARRFVPLA